MKIPEDYDDHSNLTPAVVKSIAVVTAFVAVILVLVLALNDKGRKNSSVRQNDEVYASAEPVSPVVVTPDTDDLVSGSKLRPEDLEFWDMYPKATEEPVPTEEPKEEEEEDPSTDGKHTLVKYADGGEEWVLINPYLPKHEYDFTKLVCQSNLMK